jgi:hypothetical protein
MTAGGLVTILPKFLNDFIIVMVTLHEAMICLPPVFTVDLVDTISTLVMFSERVDDQSFEPITRYFKLHPLPRLAKLSSSSLDSVPFSIKNGL